MDNNVHLTGTQAVQIEFHSQTLGEIDVFYRVAGPIHAPVLLLLHGFPTASHMFRDLIPHLAGHYRVIAPDLPGFGDTKAPQRGAFACSFDHLAQVIDGFTEALHLDRYALYIFDYGAPVGLRLAMAHPDRVTAIISQNGNAYIEGLSDVWAPWRAYWAAPTTENREECRPSRTPEAIRSVKYLHSADASLVSPDGYTLDTAYMARPGAADIQLDLILDYASNLALYPAFQAYFRAHTPPLLAIWGRNDPHFLPAGALAFRRDLPEAEIVLLDTGHFALETHAAKVGEAMHRFLADHVGGRLQ